MLPILIYIGKNPKDSNAKAAYFGHLELPLTHLLASSCLGIRSGPANESSAV
jgi:hypothetical protein